VAGKTNLDIWEAGNSFEKIGKSFMIALKYVQTNDKYAHRLIPNHTQSQVKCLLELWKIPGHSKGLLLLL
jgi:hypothetical protein